MDKLDRFLALNNILSHRRTAISLIDLAREMECSQNTVTTHIKKLRNELDAPIVFNKSQHGYLYDPEGSKMFELPGLWLSARELQALVMLIHLLENLGHALLGEDLLPMDERMTRLLEKRGISRDSLTQRIKVLPLSSHSIDEILLLRVGRSLVHRLRLRIRYVDYQGRKSHRVLSPQRMAYYRDNWYLDAWCHKRQAIRIFTLSRIENADVLEEAAIDCEESDLDAELGSGYGIFAGKDTQTAELVFDAVVARDVASRTWHPQQRGKWEGESYSLSFPYSDDRELIKDVMSYLPYVDVRGPEALRDKVSERVRAALVLYG